MRPKTKTVGESKGVRWGTGGVPTAITSVVFFIFAIYLLFKKDTSFENTLGIKIQHFNFYKNNNKTYYNNKI